MEQIGSVHNEADQNKEAEKRSPAEVIAEAVRNIKAGKLGMVETNFADIVAAGVESGQLRDVLNLLAVMIESMDTFGKSDVGVNTLRQVVSKK